MGMIMEYSNNSRGQNMYVESRADSSREPCKATLIILPMSMLMSMSESEIIENYIKTKMNRTNFDAKQCVR